MQISSQDVNINSPDAKFYSLSSIVTLILLPPFCFLTIPAVIFSKEAKKLHLSGNASLASVFARKAKRFTVAAWALFAILTMSLIAVDLISHLSLI